MCLSLPYSRSEKPKAKVTLMPTQTWPAPGGLNIYTCDTCGKAITSIDRDRGTTPFLIGCFETWQCPGPMQSAGYPKTLPDDLPTPTLEWIAPTPAELAAYLQTVPLKAHRGMVRDHVARGGLVSVRVQIH